MSHEPGKPRVTIPKAPNQPSIKNDAASLEELPQRQQQASAHRVDLDAKIERLLAAQAEANASVAHYRELYDLAPLAYVIVNESGDIVQANTQAAAILGVPQKNLVNQPIASFIYLQDQDVYRRQTTKSSQPNACELRMVKPNGTFFWVQLALSTTQTNGHQKTRMVFSDISDTKLSIKALQSSEELYRLIVQTAQEGIWRINSSSLTDYVNPMMAQMMGYAPEEMLGRPIDDFLDAAGRARLGELIKRRKEGVAEQFEFEYLRKDGSKLGAFVSTNPITNSLGEYVGAVALLTDISSHKAAEAARRDSDERYRTLFENAGDGILILERDRFIDCNARSLEMFGCSKREDIIGFPPYKFSPTNQPNGRNSIEFAIEKISSALSGLPQCFEWLHTKLDGTSFPAEVTLNKVESGGRVLLQAIVRDITERRQTELALKASVAFNHSLISSMHDGFAVLDAQGIHIVANPALCRMTGFSQEELTGTAPPFPYWPPDELERINAAFVETMSGNFRDIELNFQRKSGERFPVMISPSCVKNSNGETVNFLATVKDITARKQAETALAHTTDMLKRTGRMAKIGGWELDLNPKKLFWSLETCTLFEVDSLSAPTLEDAIAFYAPEERPKIAAAVQSAINHGTAYDLELKVVSARGRTFWARSQGSPVIENGVVVKLIGTFQDIDERKHAELKYLRELQFNETLVDHTSAIIVLLDRQGNMVHVNQATVDIMGFSREELLGKTPWAVGIMSEEEKIRAIERLQSLLKGGSNPPRETILTDKKGQDHLFSLSSISTRSADGSIDRIIVTGTDLTERSRLQKELLNVSEQEQARIGHNLHDGVGQTLTGVATLMSALEFELGEDHRDSVARIRELVGEAIQEVRRMSHGLSPSAVKNRGLEGALKLLAETIRINHRTSCEFLMDPGIAINDLEKETHVYRIAQEACNNAIRHGKPTKITISLRMLSDRECVIKIENDGSKLRKSPDAGIGLQIMDYRANLIGGTLNITSKGTRGVTVSCRFQRSPDPKSTRLPVKV